LTSDRGSHDRLDARTLARLLKQLDSLAPRKLENLTKEASQDQKRDCEGSDKVNAAGPPKKVEPLFHNLVYDTQDET